MRRSNRLLVRSLLTPSLALAAAAFSGQASAIQDCELNGESVSPYNGSTTAGKTGLMRCKDHDSGVVQREQEIRNGVFMGVVRSFDQGKLVREQFKNERGNLDGPAREFSPEGQLLRESRYENGRESGLVRSFYPSGQLQRASWQAGGEKAYAEFTESGQLGALGCGDKPYLAPAADDAKLCAFSGGPSQVEFFSGKGVVRSRATYVAGKRLRLEELHDNGTPALRLELAGEQRIEQRFSESGVKRREIVSLAGERGFKQSDKEFSESGSLLREQRWNAGGDLVLEQTFYLNGQPRSKTEYSGSGTSRVADETMFFDSGQRSASGRYAVEGGYKQAPIGVHQRFNAQGVLVRESSYDDKGRLTRERAWDGSGQLERDDEVFEDGSRKAYSK